MGIIEDRSKRTEWFRHDRFGMFIHWGIYSVPARGEWVRNAERISNAAYRPYFEEFAPDRYDPREWAALARQAGMKYAVMTAKHHDGFCLFDSKLTDFKSTNTPARRDLIREYVDAFRAEGLKVGLYYSLLDWHHEGYPAYGDAYHPMRDDPAFKGRNPDFRAYIDYLHAQVRELLTGYGQIDLIWFDFSYGDMNGEKWEATKLVRMARELQPGILIDNRLEGSGEGFGSIVTRNPSEYAGDFAAPEQLIPNEGITDEDGRSVPWEACFTMNESWGYNAGDSKWKSARRIIRKLVECVGKDGNLLLNVGPTARGEFPEPSVRILKEIGSWMRGNGASIYGCGAAGLPKPDWGWYTRNGKKLYAHVLETPIGPLCLPDLAGKIVAARRLPDASEIKEAPTWNTKAYPRHAFLSLASVDPAIASAVNAPESLAADDADTVIGLALRET